MKNMVKLTAALLLAVLFLTGCPNNVGPGETPAEKNLTGINVTKAPDKTEYLIGASLDLSGIEVTAIYSNNTKERVYIGVNSVSGFDSSTPGIKTVTITYKGQTADFTVTVNNIILLKIEITAEPVKKSYWMYELIELDGIEVRASYSDGSTELIDTDELTISGFNRAAAGVQQVTVSFGGKSDTFTVTIAASVFTVYFDKNGGDSEADPEAKTVTQPEENIGSLPTPPVKSGGYHFTGWNTHADGTGINFTADSLVTESFTVYAQWFKPVVTFNSNGGSAVPSQDIDYGDIAIKPENPVKNAYALKFEGWYTDDTTFNNPWDFTNTVTANVALYAKWAPYELGDTGPGGGKIFYRSEIGFTVKGATVAANETAYYLEASPEDLGNADWGADRDDIEDETGYATGDEIGDGKFNTQILVKLLTDNKEKDKAAQLCASYANNGFSDWFLPSKDELYQLFVNRTAAKITLQTSTTTRFYWSSSEGNSSTYAWAYSYSGDTITSTHKLRSQSSIIRAIRAF